MSDFYNLSNLLVAVWSLSVAWQFRHDTKPALIPIASINAGLGAINLTVFLVCNAVRYAL